ncbi:MAG: 5-carboxymethyl-2-hydroxymuconate isomerase [Ramlibacter sp.]|nr:5-carboxymethyl-2-hydroxymuconate isomerase [Ramlibacter sp.]
MKLVRYAAPEPHWGLLHDGLVRSLGSTAQASEQAALDWLVDRGRPAPAVDTTPVPLEGLTLLAPLAREATVYCIGFNYRSHAAESGRDVPPHPTVFIRTAASLVGSGAAMLRPRASSHYDYEGELAVVIGRGGRHIPEAQALSHVGALTCFNDGSVRDFQQHSLAAGKNFARSGACGPALTSVEEAGDLDALPISTRLNGVLVQQSTTALLVYPIAQLVSYLSEIVELRTGDLIATGTPEGVGFRRVPPLWLQAGDTVAVEVGGVGRLVNRVEDEPS